MVYQHNPRTLNTITSQGDNNNSTIKLQVEDKRQYKKYHKFNLTVED